MFSDPARVDSQAEFPISSDAGDQTSPSAGGGNTVVWLDSRNGGSDVYGAAVSYDAPLPASCQAASRD